jgi:hypothetical protein
MKKSSIVWFCNVKEKHIELERLNSRTCTRIIVLAATEFILLFVLFQAHAFLIETWTAERQFPR